ncbi:AbgT family transporter [Thermohalobacter berrensis]|uniref:Aminobenzoyl-glutamate transporter n=1 Tax=Thermohalobacter berrensis TaxID=99594 RepID=A0A419SXS4_9FIRM|nr:AbgT family transporter [Thermohalobacter berrensis]RKD30062.1 aminobenzoyl-glutamate transporter [Thermohalobacter berrensis]
MSQQGTSVKRKENWADRFLNVVERVGNRLPHPVTLFFIFAAIVVIFSFLLSLLGVEAQHPGTGETIKVVNLLSKDGIRMILTKAVDNFTSFAPLGTVLVAMLGVGVAERSGLIAALLKKMVLGAPDKLITAVVVFAGVMSSMAADAGYVVLVPLGAIIFLAKGRHPLAGLAAAFAGVSGGFSSNLLVTMLDPLLGGFTTSAANLLDPNYAVLPTANWFFMFASTFLITAVGVFVTEKIIEPRLGEYKGTFKKELEPITKQESKALNFAFITVIVFVLIIAAMLIPENGLLRSDEGNILQGIPFTPFVSSMVLLIALFFFIPGIAFGIKSGSIKNDKDVAEFMSETMSSMGGYVVLAFAAAQFVSYFAWSNIGLILAIKGADFLRAINLTGIPLILMFILVCAFINIFIGSASAKWAIMAPVFVPMLMQLGYSPELAQLSYRIGDSITNIISPLMSYFAIIVAFGKKYDPKLGIGTLISTMLPYSIVFGIAWMIMLVIWLVLGIPIGPGAPTMIPPM